MTRNNSIIKLFEGKKIRIDPTNNYPCLTDMARATGKKVNDFLRLDSTNDFIGELSFVAGIPVTNLLFVGDKSTGSWAHPQLAIKFAGWLSAKFEVLMTGWIFELLSTGKVELNHVPTPLAIIATDDIERTDKMGRSVASRGYPVAKKEKLAPPENWRTISEFMEVIMGDRAEAKASGASVWCCRQMSDLYRANTGLEPLKVPSKRGGVFCYPPEYFEPIKSHYEAWAKEHSKVLEAIKLESVTKYKQCNLFDTIDYT